MAIIEAGMEVFIVSKGTIVKLSILLLLLFVIIINFCDTIIDMGGTNSNYFNEENKSGCKETTGLLSIDIKLLFNEYTAHTQYPAYTINSSDSSYYMTTFFVEKNKENASLLKEYKITNLKYKIKDTKGNDIPVVNYYASSRFRYYSSNEDFFEQDSYYECMQDDPVYITKSINNMIQFLQDKNIYDIAMIGVIIEEPLFLKKPLSLEYELVISNGKESFEISKNTKLTYKK